MRLTVHSRQRLKERAGLPKRAHERLVAQALQHGITHHDVQGQFHGYLMRLFHKNPRANNIRVWAEKVFFFNEDVLITVFEVPHVFRKASRKIQRRKVEAESEAAA